MQDVLNNAKFWTALAVLAQAILFYFVPAFPKEIWAAIDALIAVVIGTLAVKEIRAAKQDKE